MEIKIARFQTFSWQYRFNTKVLIAPTAIFLLKQKKIGIFQFFTVVVQPKKSQFVFPFLARYGLGQFALEVGKVGKFDSNFYPGEGENDAFCLDALSIQPPFPGTGGWGFH